MLGLCCCMGFSLVMVHRLLIVVASLEEHRLWGARVSVVVVLGFSGWWMGLVAPWHVGSSQIRD